MTRGSDLPAAVNLCRRRFLSTFAAWMAGALGLALWGRPGSPAAPPPIPTWLGAEVARHAQLRELAQSVRRFVGAEASPTQAQAWLEARLGTHPSAATPAALAAAVRGDFEREQTWLVAGFVRSRSECCLAVWADAQLQRSA